MKRLLSILFLFNISAAFSQYFAPENATWHYGVDYQMPDWSTNMIEGFAKIESIGDSTINNQVCSTLKFENRLFCYFQPDTICVYYSNDSVFFYDTLIQDFQLLYDFNANTGDSWEIKIAGSQDVDTLNVLVDSTDMIDVNGTQLKRQYVTYSVQYDHEQNERKYNSVIIERIGDISYLLNFEPGHNLVCDGALYVELRCYEDNVLGFYDRQISSDCEYQGYVGITELNGKQVVISPNPTSKEFRIEGLEDKSYEIVVYDAYGKLVNAFQEKEALIVSDLQSGIYHVQIKLNGEKAIWQKLIVQ